MNTAAPTGKAKSSSHSAGQYISLGTSSRSSTISFLPASLGIPNLRPLVALEEDEQDTEPISALPQRPAPSVQSRPAPAGGTAEPEQDASGWIEAHNNYRKQYGAPPLLWDETLSQKAQRNAELCSHSHSNTGENIAWITPGLLTARQTVDVWMSEAPLYNWDKPGYEDKWGHFTQVVWKDARRVGCYVAQCPNKGSQATCEYDPVGNYVDDFATNVLRKGSAVEGR